MGYGNAREIYACIVIGRSQGSKGSYDIRMALCERWSRFDHSEGHMGGSLSLSLSLSLSPSSHLFSFCLVSIILLFPSLHNYYYLWYTRVDTYDGLNYMSCSLFLFLFNLVSWHRLLLVLFEKGDEMIYPHTVNNHTHHLQTFRTNLSLIPSFNSVGKLARPV